MEKAMVIAMVLAYCDSNLVVEERYVYSHNIGL